MQVTVPVSAVRARVKLDLTSSVVQPTGSSKRRDEREAHRGVHERHGETGVDDSDRVVVELGRLAFEDSPAASRLDEAEVQRLRDRRWRELPGCHQLHQLEARATGHRVAQGERVGPRVRASAIVRHGGETLPNSSLRKTGIR